tara:strand:+ start:776 stop:1093 length:318 start_codon:yes stop_codon:yes gene_type:complete
MARSRLGNKKDANHKELVKIFENAGCSVLDISSLPNCCDVIVSKYGRSIFCEIKDGKKPPSQRKLTDGEIKFMNETQGAWRLVQSEDDAYKFIQELNSFYSLDMR